MKTLIGLAAILLAGMTFTTQAQSNITINGVEYVALASNTAGPVQTNLMPALPPIQAAPLQVSIGGQSNGVVAIGTQVVKDAYNQFKDASFKNGFTADFFGIYHKGDYGGGLSLATTATNAINYGFAIALIQEKKVNADGTTTKAFTFYDSSFNVSFNGDTSLPVLGHAQYFVETGAAVDLSAIQGGIYNQSIAGVKKTWDINGNIYVAVWGGAGYLSKWNDAFYIGGISITDKLKGSHLFGVF
jgi:hypothetical protein